MAATRVNRLLVLHCFTLQRELFCNHGGHHRMASSIHVPPPLLDSSFELIATRDKLGQTFSSKTRTSPFSSSTISLYSIGSRPPESIPEFGRAPVPMPPARGPVIRGASGTRSRGNGEGMLRVKNTCRLVLVAMHTKAENILALERTLPFRKAFNCLPNLAAILLDLESSPSVPG